MGGRSAAAGHMVSFRSFCKTDAEAKVSDLLLFVHMYKLQEVGSSESDSCYTLRPRRRFRTMTSHEEPDLSAPHRRASVMSGLPLSDMSVVMSWITLE